MKRCTKCGEEKALDAYYMDKGKPRGCCKDCHKKKTYELRDADRAAHNAKRKKWREAHPEKYKVHARKHLEKNRDEINERRRQQRAEDPERFRALQRESWARRADQISVKRKSEWPEIRDEVNAQRRAGRAADPEAIRAVEREWRRKNPDRVSKHNRRFYEANRELYEVHRRKREARKAGVEYQPYTRAEIYERDGGRCRGCHKPLDNAPGAFQLDHIVPISLGGPDIPANIQLMCPPCNRRKWAHLDGQIHLPV